MQEEHIFQINTVVLNGKKSYYYKTHIISLSLLKFYHQLRQRPKDKRSMDGRLGVTDSVHTGLIIFLCLECSFIFHFIQILTFLPIPKHAPSPL